MKAIRPVLLMILAAGTAFSEPVEFWEMNDRAGTELQNLVNSGSQKSAWNFESIGAADGQGNFIVRGDGGSYTRKLPTKGSANAHAMEDRYATPITAGSYRLEIDFSAWNIAASSAAAQDALSFGVNDAAGNRIARIALRSAGDIQFSGFDGGYRTVSVNAVESGTNAYAIEFDFDTDTIEYFANGSSIYSGVMSGSDIGTFIFTKNGEWNTADTWFKIDSMGLRVIQKSVSETDFEPETIGIITF
jgi:hypothetical protein